MTVSFRALGTTAVLVVAEPDRVATALAELQRELAAVDAACSRFREDSELMAVNRAAGRRVAIGPLFCEALEAAISAASTTGGLVDPTVGRALRLSGYDATFQAVLARDGAGFRPRFELVPGWRTIELDARERTVRIPPGVELDLGATGKALAADRAARAAAAAAGCGALVSLGGDIAVAGEPPAGGWAIRIADDHRAPLDGPGPTVAISSGGLATSSTAARSWQTAAGRVHHLVDPRTGRPAAGPWRTVSVAARSCVEANVASTAALVLAGRAPAWLAARALPARLAPPAGP
ncbi:MAG: FAD:protein FMN transferase, partial [Gaiellaceae bacterium]